MIQFLISFKKGKGYQTGQTIVVFDGLEDLTDFVVTEIVRELLSQGNIPETFLLNGCKRLTIWSLFYLYRLKMEEYHRGSGLFDLPNRRPVLTKMVRTFLRISCQKNNIQ